MNWYIDVLKKYVEFSGRATRQEYWMFTLFNVLIMIGLNVLTRMSSLFTIVYGLYALAVLLPSLGVAVRRLHDTGRSGWWLLLALVPLANIVLLVFLCLDSVPDNEYGPNPKGGAAPAPVAAA